MSTVCTCPECATLDLGFPLDGPQLSLLQPRGSAPESRSPEDPEPAGGSRHRRGRHGAARSERPSYQPETARA